MTSELLSDTKIEGLFAEILTEFKVDLVHFHHLMYLPISLPLICSAVGVPSLWQMHDYFLICDRYNLLTKDRRFCDVVSRGAAQCDGCLSTMDDRPAGSKARRDGLTALVAKSLDAIIASTPWSGDYLGRFFPEIGQNRTHILPLPSTTTQPTAGSLLRKAQGRDRLVIAVPGNFTDVKGADDVIEIIRLCADYDIDFEVFGRVQDRYMDLLLGADPGRVRLHRGYRHDQIVGLMLGCDVSLHLSIWPETFMMSLSEAWEAGLVPIVTDLGAPAERVQDGVNGFKVPPNDPTAAFQLILRLYFDRGIIAEISKSISNISQVSVSEHVTLLSNLYMTLITAKPRAHSLVPNHVRADRPLSLFDCGLRLNSPHWCSRENRWDRQEQPADSHGLKPQYVKPVELPERDRRLPTRTLRLGNPSETMEIDLLQIDGRDVLTGNRVLAAHDLRLDGWILGGEDFDPRCTYLRLKGRDATRVFLLDSVDRSDLAVDAMQTGTSKAGFTGAVSLEGLPGGVYAIDLMQPSPDTMLLCEEMTRVTIIEHRRQEYFELSKWTLAKPSALGRVRSTTLASERFLPRQQNLDVVMGHTIGRTSDVMWIEGGMPAALSTSDVVLALLDDVVTQGRSYQVALRPDESDAADGSPSRITVVGSLEEVLHGNYSLRLMGIEGAQATVVETDIRFFMSPVLGRFAWSEMPPPMLGRMTLESPEMRSTLDRATIVASGQGVAHEEFLFCQGWSFTPGFGPPNCVVLRWEDNGKPRFGICEPVPRWDVMENLRNPNAANPGFECCVPSQVLEAGIRFFQCFDQALVEWVGFDQALRQCFTM